MTSLLRVLALAVAGSTLALTGCSAEVHIGGYDSSKVASQIKAAQEKAAPDMTVSKATCPKDPGKLKKGLTFECTVVIEGVEAPYKVKITSVKNDKAHFDYEPAKAIISVALAEQFLQKQLQANNQTGVNVKCSDKKVIVQAPKSTFTCTLSKGAQSQQVTLLVKDTTGNIAIQN